MLYDHTNQENVICINIEYCKRIFPLVISAMMCVIISGCTLNIKESDQEFAAASFPASDEGDFLNYKVDEFGNSFIEGTFKGRGADLRGNELEPILIPLPKGFANGKFKKAMEDIVNGKKDYRKDTDKVEIILYLQGSKWGTQCHDPAGDYHCH